MTRNITPLYVGSSTCWRNIVADSSEWFRRQGQQQLKYQLGTNNLLKSRSKTNVFYKSYLTLDYAITLLLPSTILLFITISTFQLFYIFSFFLWIIISTLPYIILVVKSLVSSSGPGGIMFFVAISAIQMLIALLGAFSGYGGVC